MKKQFIDYLKSLPPDGCNQVCHPLVGHVQSFLSTTLGGGDVELSPDLTSFTHKGASHPLDPDLASCVQVLDKLGSERGSPVEDDFISVSNALVLSRLDEAPRRQRPRHPDVTLPSGVSNSAREPSFFGRAVNLLTGPRFSELDLADPKKIPPLDFNLSPVSWSILRAQLTRSEPTAFALFQRTRIIAYCRRTSWEPAGWCVLGTRSFYGGDTLVALRFPSLPVIQSHWHPRPMPSMKRSRFHELAAQYNLSVFMQYNSDDGQHYGLIAADSSSHVIKEVGGQPVFFAPDIDVREAREDYSRTFVTWVSLV